MALAPTAIARAATIAPIAARARADANGIGGRVPTVSPATTVLVRPVPVTIVPVTIVLATIVLATTALATIVLATTALGRTGRPGRRW
jgi:hypothetical protein